MKKATLLLLISSAIALSGCVTNQSQPDEKQTLYSSLVDYIKKDTKLGWLTAWREEVEKGYFDDHIEIYPLSFGRYLGYCPQNLNASSSKTQLDNRVLMLCGMYDGTYEDNGWCIRQQDKIPLFYFQAWVNNEGVCFTARGSILYKGFFPPNQDDYMNPKWTSFYKQWLENKKQKKAQRENFRKNKEARVRSEEERIKEETIETIKAKPGTLLCRRVPFNRDKITRGYKVQTRDDDILVQYEVTHLINGVMSHSSSSTWDEASMWYKCSK